jgi:hypothetical protein
VQQDPVASLLLTMAFLVLGLRFLLGRSGIFRGFSEGFWAAFWSLLLLGSRRSPGSANPLGCLVRLVLSLLLLGLVFATLMGLTSLPGK